MAEETWGPWIYSDEDESPPAGVYIMCERRQEWLAFWFERTGQRKPKVECFTVTLENPGECRRYKVRVTASFAKLQQIVEHPASMPTTGKPEEKTHEMEF